MVKNIEWNEDDQIFIVDVKEYIELSAVTCAGFGNTSANKESAIYLAEKLGNNEVLEKLKAEGKTISDVLKPKNPKENVMIKNKLEETDDEDDEKDKYDDDDDKEDEADA